MKSIRSAAGLSTLAVGVACALSGCGGANSNTFADIKGVNLVPNGGVATVNATGTSLANLAFLSAPVTTAPSYSNASAGTESATFLLSAETGTTYPTYTTSLNSGQFYTAMVLGRTDVVSTDARYPKLEIAGDDQTTPASNDCRFRIVQAAPDAPTNVAVSISFGSSTVNASPTTAYGAITSYSELPAGAANVTVYTSGTNTVLIPSTVINTLAGHRYTIYITEPTVTSSTYSIQIAEDS